MKTIYAVEYQTIDRPKSDFRTTRNIVTINNECFATYEDCLDWVMSRGSFDGATDYSFFKFEEKEEVVREHCYTIRPLTLREDK